MVNNFRVATRDELREVFQPSKVLLAVVVRPGNRHPNILPVCFHMWCSYSPILYAVAIEQSNYSAEVFRSASEFVLAIPGEGMLQQVVFCGTHSGRDLDKAGVCGIPWVDSVAISTPCIACALANMEMVIEQRMYTGDHMLIIASVRTIRLADNIHERPLLAVGPVANGYEVLWEEGIHAIGVVPRGDKR